MSHAVRRRSLFCFTLAACVPLACPAAEVDAAPDPPPPDPPAVAEYLFDGLRLCTDLPPAQAEAEGRRAAANVAAFRALLRRPVKRRPVRLARFDTSRSPLSPEGDPVEVFAWDRAEKWSGLPLPPQAGAARAIPGGAALLPAGGAFSGILRDGPPRSEWYGPARDGLPGRGAVAGLLATDYGVTESSWLRDGLAEVGRYRTAGGGRVQVPKDVYDYLRGTAAHPDRRPRVGAIADVDAGPPEIEVEFFPYGLDPATSAPFRWAFTHMMLHNPNYAPRFRRMLPDELRAMGRAEAAFAASRSPSQPLQQVVVQPGRGVGVTLEPVAPPTSEYAQSLAEAVEERYDDAFGGDALRLQFEFDRFLDAFEQGADPSLTAWDWSVTPVPLKHGRLGAVRLAVRARRGWQATGALLTAGQEVKFLAKGNWAVGPDAPVPPFDPIGPREDAEPADPPPPVGADGGADGRGRLVAAVFDPLRFGLSEEFELGARGRFVAPTGGHLVLRCRDAWGELSDNAGSVAVRLEGVNAGAK